jgi:uncharacterized repeat protein (TIGR03806 family)
MQITAGQLRLAEDVLQYDLNTPLFSDYALKLRTVSLPKGMAAEYRDEDVFDFPVGTVITKSFYYPVGVNEDEVLKVSREQVSSSRALDLSEFRLMETRILARRETGWAAFPYVWNEAQTEAVLKRIGDVKRLTLVDGTAKAPFAYVVPNINQCAGCHAVNATTREIQPIGPKARHLNRDFTYNGKPENQLVHWSALGILEQAPEPNEVPHTSLWGDNEASLNDRARAYLDINCAHCHNEVGPADTSGLHLEPSTPVGAHLGKCKMPIAAGTGTGGRKYGIVPGKPDASIFTYRMESTNPAEMMPELGRSLAHKEGVRLIKDWIAAMDGACEL